MRTTKDQRRFIVLCSACGVLLIILFLCLQVLYDWQQQTIRNADKQTRVVSLQQALQNVSEEALPSNNQFELLQRIGRQNVTRITQEKDIICELTCTYARLLDILQEYAADPGNIRSLQIVRDKSLLVTLHIAAEKDPVYE